MIISIQNGKTTVTVEYEEIAEAREVLLSLLSAFEAEPTPQNTSIAEYFLKILNSGMPIVSEEELISGELREKFLSRSTEARKLITKRQESKVERFFKSFNKCFSFYPAQEDDRHYLKHHKSHQEQSDSDEK